MRVDILMENLMVYINLFNRSGSPKHQSNSVNGDFHGKYIEWYEYSKHIKTEWNYVNGKKHGQQKVKSAIYNQ